MKYRQKCVFYTITILLLIGCKNQDKKEANKEPKNSDSYILVEDWPNLS